MAVGQISALAAVCLGFFDAAAIAQSIPSMTLAPGEAITIGLNNSGQDAALQRHRAEWSDFDVYAARHLTGITPPDAPVPVAAPFTPDADDPRPAPIPPGLIRVRFHSVAGRHSLLVVENGLQGAVAYRARITVKGDARSTDVCVVMPGLPSYEHWPHPIDSIELSSFRHVPWQPGQTPTCE